MERMRIYWVSPFPPVVSGLSAYSEAFTQYLKSRDFDVIRTLPEDAPKAAKACKENLSSVIIYNIGNHPVNLITYETALQHPGIVILHDANLHDLAYAYAMHKGGLDYYGYQLANEPGIKDADIRALIDAQGSNRQLMSKFNLLAELSYSGCRFIVHSKFAAGILQKYRKDCGILKANHFSVWFDRGDCDRNTIGVFGFMSDEKHVKEILNAFLEYIRGRDSALKLLFIGEDAGADIRKMLAGISRESVVMYQGLNDAEYMEKMRSIGAIINLRHPTRGEMSGNAVKAMSMGIPLALNREDAFSEIPEDCVYSIDMEHMGLSLTGFFNAVENDYDRLKITGANAAEYATKAFNIKTIASEIIRFASEDVHCSRKKMRKRKMSLIRLIPRFMIKRKMRSML